MDPHTFGNSPACTSLSEVLTELDVSVQRKIKSKVQRTLDNLSIVMKFLITIPDHSLKYYLIDLCLREQISKIDKFDAPQIVKDLTKNIAFYRYNYWLKKTKKGGTTREEDIPGDTCID